MRLRSLVALCLASTTSVWAQSARRDAALSEAKGPTAESREQVPKGIQDNSFLLEEAYNQEPAVVQHISTLIFERRISSWLYALTDEWPVNGQRHQLSVTLPLQSTGDGASAALGDVALNYRLQLVGSGETRFAVAPRVSVLLPASTDPGAHHLGVQSNVASSFMATPTLALHTNAGITVGQASSVVNAGQSVIWLLGPRFNVMLESIMTHADGQNGFTISPGVRWAYNFASGLQIVPGVAFPFGFSANSGQRAFLLYLSFEHQMPGLRK